MNILMKGVTFYRNCGAATAGEYNRLINRTDNVNKPLLRVSKLTFRALALRQSELRSIKPYPRLFASHIYIYICVCADINIHVFKNVTISIIFDIIVSTYIYISIHIKFVYLLFSCQKVSLFDKEVKGLYI